MFIFIESGIFNDYGTGFDVLFLRAFSIDDIRVHDKFLFCVMYGFSNIIYFI